MPHIIVWSFVIMTESQEKIVIFRAYDTAVEANLAKTKLDAHGIPCFLTDEHLTNLYPIRNAIFPGVRLHIFEKDYDQVKSTLEEDQTEVGFIKCPSCGSHDYKQQLTDWGRLGVLLAGVFRMLSPSNPQSEYLCNNCGEKFI